MDDPIKRRPQLKMVRTWHTEKTTISPLHIDESPRRQCYILEDTVRDPNNDGIMQAEEKIPGETAIQCGTYEIIISFSDKFQQYMPLLLDVPHYDGIRIHSGVDHTHTAGCLLTGVEKSEDNTQVFYGRKAYADLMAILEPMVKHERVFIKISNDRETA